MCQECVIARGRERLCLTIGYVHYPREGSCAMQAVLAAMLAARRYRFESRPVWIVARGARCQDHGMVVSTTFRHRTVKNYMDHMEGGRK